MSGLSATIGRHVLTGRVAGAMSPAAATPRDVPDATHRQRGRTRPRGPRSPLRRRHLAVIGSAIAVVLVLLVFARALSEAAVTNERAAAHRAANVRLQQALAAGRREVELIKGDAFVRLQARAYGFGEPGERVFGLEAGAPPPRPITPLGAEPAETKPVGPLESWLELLFGR